MTTNLTEQKLMSMFHLLLDHYGPRHWWPAETKLEMMVGAVLTQNTNWKNVEKAVANLKQKKLISVKALYSIDIAMLAQEIRPAGYYNVKANRLKNLIYFIVDHYDGNVNKLSSDEVQALRQGLLSVNGIGPETADSILLYAANHPVFVIDAYTHRILYRHNIIADQATYQEMQELFMDNLPADSALFNEFHALIVEAGKDYCRKKSLCGECPLNSLSY